MEQSDGHVVKERVLSSYAWQSCVLELSPLRPRTVTERLWGECGATFEVDRPFIREFEEIPAHVDCYNREKFR